MRYDRAGNLVADFYTGQGTRIYDAENRMVAAQSASSQMSAYVYNGDGQRVRKSDAGKVFWYIYGMEDELIAEYNAAASPNSTLKEYGYRNDKLLVVADGPAASTSQTHGAGVSNVALAANGATASASSQYNGQFPVAGAINGDRYHLYLADGRYNEWHSAIGASKPDWLQVDFSGSKTINEIDIITQQDNYNAPVNPTPHTTFSMYGPTSFEVQYWTGSQWATVPGGSVNGNNKIWRKFTFAPITTSKIRVLISATVDGFSRIMEIEAYEYAPNETYLSDLDWTSMSNSPYYPSISINHSADGRVMALNGVTYGKGLGAHAPSDVRYNLGGNYTTFVCDVGIDDEATTSAGSVVFEVWADGVKLYDSGLMTPASPTKSISLSVAGRQELRLIATEAGDGPSWDHSDWAGARLLTGTSGSGGGGGGVQWLVADQLGTPRMAIDQTGTLGGVKRHDYLPFGEEIGVGVGGRTASEGYNKADGVRHRYTGKERDVETGMDYFGARYFNAAHGRFTSVDPLLQSGRTLEPQTWNRYAFVDNNPLRYVDVDGRQKSSANQKTPAKPLAQRYKPDSKRRVPKVQTANGDDLVGQGSTVGTIKLQNGKSIDAGKLVNKNDGSPLTNCHGYTFTGGELIIGNGEVPELLKAEGYQLVEGAVNVGDVAVYFSQEQVGPTNISEQVVHSAVVTKTEDGKPTEVTGFRNDQGEAGQAVTSEAGVGKNGNYPPVPNPTSDDPNAKVVRYFRKPQD